ncbi:MAG: hypothetical protein DRN81_07020 [Thermoproteota archaeon]|nr:MAG: hypothetical protein DRN81_07020 [Candidatus Korarchaeota archaeon]
MRTREILTRILGVRVGDRVRVRWICWNKDSSYFRYGYVKKVVKGLDKTLLFIEFDSGGEYFLELEDVVLARRRVKNGEEKSIQDCSFSSET